MTQETKIQNAWRSVKGAIAISILALTLIIFNSCGGEHQSAPEADMSAFSDTVYSPRHARGFSVTATSSDEEGEGVATLLTVINPWQGAKGESYRLLILPEKGDASMVPDGFKGAVLHGPAKRIVAMSTTHVAMLDAIGAADRIVGVSGLDFISSPQVAKRRDEIADVGYEGSVDYEAMASVRPDLVLLYGVSAASSMEAKLRELNIPFIYIGDYLEESPLGKAEWMMALGAITGKMERASQAFSPVESMYEQTAGLVESFAQKPYPKVMVNAPTGDNWLMPPTGSYIARLIRDAGGDYMYTENSSTESRPIDIERAWSLLSEADVWLNPGTATTMQEVLRSAPRMADTRPVKDGNVWNNNNLMTRSGGNDFYESGTVRPDRVLLDLVGILHPELSDSTSTGPVYYHKLK